MDPYHQEVYNYYEEIERKLERKAAMSRTSSNVYRSYTRQASNFVFPTLSGKISGENRPRPGQFRLSEKEIEKNTEGNYQFHLSLHVLMLPLTFNSFMFVFVGHFVNFGLRVLV